MIVEAPKLSVVECILVVANHDRRLPERQADRRVFEHQIVQGGVGYSGHIRPVRLHVEEFEGICLCNRLHPLVVLAQLRLKEHVADDDFDNVLRHEEAQRRL